MEKKSFFKESVSFTKNGQIKSSFFVYAVTMSFLFIAVHAIMLLLLLEPIHNYFTGLAHPITGGWLNLFESGIPALLAAFVCNVPFFFLPDKRFIVAAYIMILIYAEVIAVAALFIYKGDALTAFMLLLGTVLPIPIGFGLVVSSGLYAVYHFKTNIPEKTEN